MLNLGCAWGLHSFYMAATANEVIGLDHSATRIAVAESTRKALRISNVRFSCSDIRDPRVFAGIQKFDLVVAWGFLHRISDIFALLHAVSPMTDTLSLEWRTPVLPFSSKLSLAYHSTEGTTLNPQNVGPLQREGDERDSERLADRTREHGQTGFWEPTPGAVAAICAKFGYKHARLLGYGENFDSGSRTVIREWAKHVVQRMTHRKLIHQIPLSRVHMIFEKAPGSIDMQDPIGNHVEFPDWDLALQRAVAKDADVQENLYPNWLARAS